MKRVDNIISTGYKAVLINGVYYQAHRLVWIYFNGDIPEGNVIDHRNGIRSDNSLDNLRSVTIAENNHNMGVMPNRMGKVNTSKVSGGYVAKVDGNNLGVYSTQYDAASIAVYYKDKYRITYEGRDIPPDHLYHTDYDSFLTYVNSLTTVDGIQAVDNI